MSINIVLLNEVEAENKEEGYRKKNQYHELIVC